MKIYNRKGFLEQPAGTIFCKYGLAGIKQVGFADSFCIKGDSFINDYFCVDLCEIDSFSSEVRIDLLQKIVSEGISVPMNMDSQREGLFEKDGYFLVYEENDLQQLMNIIKLSLQVLRNRPKPEQI